MAVAFNGIAVDSITRDGLRLDQVKYNGDTVWSSEPDGATKLYFTLTSNLTQNLYFTQSAANGVTIDWGDGSATETVTETSAQASHTYAEAGDYIVTMTAADGVTWSPGASIVVNGAAVDYALLAAASNTTDKPQLKQFIFGDGCELSRPYVFRYCKGLTSIVVPDGTTTIQKYTFANCTNLSSVTIPSSVTQADVCAFYYCSSLDITEIAQQLTVIGPSCFYLCKTADYMELKATSIGNKAFYGCKTLRRVWLRNSVRTLEVYIGRNTQQEITTYQGPFFNCAGSLVLYAECTEAQKPSGWAAHFNCYAGTASNLVVIWAQSETPTVSLTKTWDALTQTFTYEDEDGEGKGYAYDSGTETLTIY